VIATLFANTTQPWPLRAGVVHVWRFACQQDPGPLAAALSSEEQHSAARFVAREHREAYVVQHAMSRGILARYANIDPQGLQFRRGPRGKPFLVGGGGLELNLSHADDVALLAVARDLGLGVDLERYDSPLELAALRRIVLAPDEPALDRHAFLRIWCRKEACLKATGVGLVDDLTSISVAGDRVVVGSETVHVRDLIVDADHAAALATTVECAAIGPAVLEIFSS
jgi:4'-phosphopantetheinyl transferase